MNAISADRRKTTLVTPDGVEIVLEQSGNPAGPEIVFIHGFSTSRLCWMKQVHGMLARDFRIIAYDLRGHGESAKPSDPAFYRDGQRWAGELAAVIDAAEMRKPVLVAWSYAGRIVVDYLHHVGTDAVAGLNIVGAKTNSDPAFNAPLFAPHQRGMASDDLETNVRSTIAFVEGCARKWDAPDFAQQVAAAMVVPPCVRAALLGRPLDADDLYRAIDIPVLFTHGRHDAIAPLAAAQHGHAITPNSRLSIYENAGHAPFMEEPERFNRELAAFVTRSAGVAGL
jgi:non-heme chloroperoxidase